MSELNWYEFPRTPIHVKEENLTFHTWLEQAEYSNPTKFETLSHYTTFKNADDIMITELKSQRFNDHSCITKNPNAENHPLHFENVLCVSPDRLNSTLVEKYGNIRFYSDNLKYLENMNYYLIEFIDNCIQPVVRVLVTEKVYPTLAKFDIRKQNDGPIYLDNRGRYMKYGTFRRGSWSYFEDLEVEVLLQSSQNVHTHISYVKCIHPRSIVKDEKYTEKIQSYQCALGEIHYSMFHYQHRFNNNFIISELHQDNHEAMQIIVTTELTSQWYPLVAKPSCNNNNPNILMKQINFDKALYYREIQWEDECLVEDLHFIYVTTGVIPDAYAMVAKILDSTKKMRSYRPFAEVFNLFIDHFKSKEAQAEVQGAITKFIFFH